MFQFFNFQQLKFTSSPEKIKCFPLSEDLATLLMNSLCSELVLSIVRTAVLYKNKLITKKENFFLETSGRN